MFFYQGWRVLHLNPHFQGLLETPHHWTLQLLRHTALHGLLYKNNSMSCYSMENHEKIRCSPQIWGVEIPVVMALISNKQGVKYKKAGVINLSHTV